MEAYGVGTLSTGGNDIDLSPVNTVQIDGGAKITGQKDVHISAGTGTDFDEDEYTILATLDSYAGSLIPLDFLDANVTLDITNRVDILSGAIVESAGHVRLHTDRFGDNTVNAQAKSVNWYSGGSNPVTAAEAEGGVEQFAGNASSPISGIVNVAGLVRTGISRNKKLIIDDVSLRSGSNPDSADSYDVILDNASTGDIQFTKSLRTVSTPLHAALEHAEEQLSLYDDGSDLNAFYTRERDRIIAQLQPQGFLDEGFGNNLVRSNPTVLEIVVAPTTATAGSIHIRAGELLQPGTLDAPTDASIQVINNTEAFLRIRGLEIPDGEKGVVLNGDVISDILSLPPSIVIDNRGDMNDPVITNNGQLSLPWPAIDVIGKISNSSGSLLLKNHPIGAGSINVFATVQAKEQSIETGNGGNVTIDQPDRGSVFEQGGEEYQQWLQFSTKGDGAERLDVRPLVNNLPAMQNLVSQTPNPSSTLSGARIYITAGNINLNGIIESGHADYTLDITPAMDVQINNLIAAGSTETTVLDSNQNENYVVRWDGTNRRILVSEVAATGGYVDITGQIANTRNGKINIMSGHAQVRINNPTDHDIQLNRLDVSQRGNGTLIIKDIRQGSGGVPTVTTIERFADGLYASGPGYSNGQSVGNNLTYNPQSGLRYGWTIVQRVSKRTVTSYAQDSSFGIDWLNPDEDAETNRYEENIARPMIDESGVYFTVDTSDNSIYSYSSETFNDFKRGPFDSNKKTTYSGIFNQNKRVSWDVTVEEGNRTLHHHSIRADRPIGIDFFGADDALVQIISGGDVYIAGNINNPDGRTIIHSDGDIHHMGGIVGGEVIALQSKEKGAIGADGKPVQIALTQNIPFDHLSSGSTGGNTLTLHPGERVLVAAGHSAGGNIGDVYRFTGSRRSINLSTANYNDNNLWTRENIESQFEVFTQDGHVFAHEVSGDMWIRQIRANDSEGINADGDVTLTAESGIYGFFSAGNVENTGFIDGNSINLIAKNGDIGTDSKPIISDVGYFLDVKDPAYKFSANASDDIHLLHGGTLIVDQITAGGDLRILSSPGATLVDGNTADIRDTRSIEELVEGSWGTLRLTNDLGFDTKRQDRIDALVSTQTIAYQSYWTFRNRQDDPAIYDPNFRVPLTTDEQTFHENRLRTVGESQGLSGDALDTFIVDGIETLINSRSTQYHTLHETWGTVGDVHDPNFQYQPTADETAAIDNSMRRWTREELLNLRGSHFINVTDTEFLIEQPNLIGETIFINNGSGGIGRYQNGLTVRLRENDGSLSPLDLDAHAAILAAEPGDIVFTSQEPVEVIAKINENNKIVLQSVGIANRQDWRQLGFNLGDSLMLESATTDSTDAGDYYEITAINGFEITVSSDKPLTTDAFRNITVAPVITD
ncbi:MAG: hypothetical protein AAFN70_00785, partial [Planctomycetota bacterium]